VSGVVVVTTLIKFSGSVAIFAVWSGGLNACMLWRCVTEVQLKLEMYVVALRDRSSTEA